MRKKKAIIYRNSNGDVYYVLHGCNGKPLCESKPVKRKHLVISVLENNFSDFIIIDKS